MATRPITRSCIQLSSSNSASAARTFIQLTPQRHLRTPLPVFDFLLPSISSSTVGQAYHIKPVSTSPASQARRAFTSSSIRQQTSAIINPRKDDDGNDMNIEITPRASNRLQEIMSKDSNPNLALRIQVESGGCHGFQYLMSLTTLPPLHPSNVKEEAAPAPNTSSDPNAIASKSLSDSTLSGANTKNIKVGKLDEDDTVFVTDDWSGAKVVMDGPSLELLKGSKVDFTMELIGRPRTEPNTYPLKPAEFECLTGFCYVSYVK
ncbi:hypothetical protein B7494_g6050 [Chlorociboria aeruginascens]|nr:hypothetical protein B7494_g6050 [Chlorociboria aeruginascens]